MFSFTCHKTLYIMFYMKQKITNYLWFTLICVLISSCATRQGDFSDRAIYERALKTNSVSQKAYDKFETKLIANATYKDLDFIEAQIKQKGDSLLYDSGQINSLTTSAKRDNIFFVNFFVSVFTPDDRYADFSKKKGLWRFYLKKGRDELIEAHSVRLVDNDRLAEYEALYPYISSWSTCYEVSFARSDLYNATKKRELFRPFSLVITGQIGQVELEYE